MDELILGTTRLELRRGDITAQEVDAIVNAANARLAGGGGVDGAIHRAGGPSIMRECRAIGGCRTGGAVVTGAGRLRAKHVIHAVAPRYAGRPGDAALLRSAYAASLERAEALGVRSIAFPSLGTGAYGYPIDQAAAIALDACIEHTVHGTCIALIRFVLFSDPDLRVYAATLQRLAP
ncbi:MAG: O-acetyl-ADP-ribose deacetylase [bacterium]|nr:O-acetyl-ADP-ribose deacetylase [bacterium]